MNIRSLIANHSPLKITAVILITVLISGITYAGTQIVTQNNSINLSQGLVGKWDFNGDATDSSGNSNDGTVNGATLTEDRFGNADSAYSFSNTNSITIPDDNSLEPSSITMSIWLNPTSWSSGSGHKNIIVKRDSSGTGYFFFKFGSTEKLTVDFGGSSERWNTGALPGLNDWVHLVYTYDQSSDTGSFYVDGMLVNTTNLGDPANVPSTGNLELGGGYSYDGKMDDFRMYNRAINDSEVEALYNGQTEAGSVTIGNLQKGLVGWWELDGDAKDATPYSNHGTINGTATLTTDRRNEANSAYEFSDSSYGDIDAGNDPILDFAGEDFSVSLWVKAVSTESNRRVLTRGYYREGGWELFASNGMVEFRTNQNNAHQGTSANGVLSLNDWHHVAVNYHSGTASIYVDGALAGTGNGHIAPASSIRPLVIGARSGAGSYHYGGSIDDVRIYNRILLDSEVEQLAGQYQPVIAVSELSKGLVADWDFNGDAKDKTPYSNHGTVSGATLTTDRMGVVDSAYSFDGSNDKISTSSSPILNNSSEATISFWLNIPLQPSNYRRVISSSPGGNGNLEVYFTSDGDNGLFGQFGDSSGWVCLNPDLIGGWHHIVLIASSTDNRLKCYVDTNLESNIDNGFTQISIPSFNVGVTSNGSSYYLDGTVDDIKIYNRALSAPEVERLYETY